MINLVSAWSQEYAPLADITWFKNKALYAKKHGYGAKYYIHPERGDIAWNRVEIWLDALNKVGEGNYIFWTGADALITKPEKKVEEFIKEGVDFIFCMDACHRGVFSDCFIMKSSEVSKVMLQRILDSRCRDQGRDEQQALSEYLYQGSFRDYVRNLDRSANPKDLLSYSPVKIDITPFGAFVGDCHSFHSDGIIPPEKSWTMETFVLHVGGKSLNFRLRHMPQFLQEIK